MTDGMKRIDESCINTLRLLSADMVEQAKSGHPGLPMGAAAMAYVLWTRFLRHNPANPKWFNRDRFVLSAGHGSALQYSLLHLAGATIFLWTISDSSGNGGARLRPSGIWCDPRGRSHHGPPGSRTGNGSRNGPCTTIFGAQVQPSFFARL